MKAIVVREPGPASTMALTEIHDPVPGPGEVLVSAAVAGVNFIDTYRRSGVYPAAFPHVPGSEGAGTVVECGPEVTQVAVGDRVAWCSSPGSYAPRVVVAADDCYAIPPEVDFATAASAMLQGLTAHYLSASTFPLREGHTALVHAGAGGVGLLLTQLAVSRGARVVTTVSSDAKERLSRQAGADAVIRYDRLTDMSQDLPAAVRTLTDNQGVDVVYDGVGASTFDGSLASLVPRGMLVLFGGASGQVPPFDLQRLNACGSLFVTRPTLADHLRTADERTWRAGEIFGAIAAGELSVHHGATYELAQASLAHEALESRRTTGKVLLTV